MKEEAANSETERDALLAQIRSLVEESRVRQANRMEGKCNVIRMGILSSSDMLEQVAGQHDRQVDEFLSKNEKFAKEVAVSEEGMQTRMRNDWEVWGCHFHSNIWRDMLIFV